MNKIKTYFSLYVDESNGRGRGVFTDQDIPKGEIVEISPVIEIKKTDENTTMAIKLILNMRLNLSMT